MQPEFVPDAKSIELKLKNQFEVLKRIDTYIGSTNTKCTIVMSYCAAAIALIFTLLGKTDFTTSQMPFAVSIALASGLSLLLAGTCMVLACTVIFPVTYSRKSAFHGNSLIFFGDIANHYKEEDSFERRFLEVSEIDYLKDLTTQVHTLSTIASKKFQKIQIITSILVVQFFVIFIFLSLCFLGSFG